MKYNLLGRTGLYVSEQSFGTMTFGGKGFWEKVGTLNQSDANVLVKTAIDEGINFFDTANVYSYGQSEEILGKSIKQLGIARDEIILATKLSAPAKKGINKAGLSRYHIFNAVDESLKRLQVNHIDILYVHGTDVNTSVENIMNSLNDVVKSGKVRYIGVCNWYAWMVMKAQMIAQANNWNGFSAMQYYYSLATRDIEREIIPTGIDLNLPVIPWSPLAGGYLTGKYKNNGNNTSDNFRRNKLDFPLIDKPKTEKIIKLLEEMAKQKQYTVAQLALAWVMQQKGVASTIIGASKAEQIKENAKACDVVFTKEELLRLEEASALQKEYPQWQVEFQAEERQNSINN
jgi:aryl-alcohol dehydrogenase-like predicted oxidoreductase